MKSPKPFGREWQKRMKARAIQEGAKNGELAVLRVYLDYVNWETGESFTGIKLLAEEANISQKTVERALRSLRDKGLLIPLKYLNGGRGRSTVYGFPEPPVTNENRRGAVTKNGKPAHLIEGTDEYLFMQDQIANKVPYSVARANLEKAFGKVA